MFKPICETEPQTITGNQLLDQAIAKFKRFLVEDLRIEDDRLNSEQGLKEKLVLIEQFKTHIKLIGKDNVSIYISNVIINHFKLQDITFKQKEKLQNFIELFIELSL